MSGTRHHDVLGGSARDRADRGFLDGDVRGRTFIRLELKTVNGAITGGISLGSFQVDRQGVVNGADAAPLNLKHILGATQKGATVTFLMKDGNDPEKFELRLLENGDADLQVLLSDEDRKELAAEGVPPPKPIRLTKAG